MIRWLERIGIVVVSLVIAIGVIALLSGGLAGGRDDPGLSGSASQGGGLGVAYRDQGDTPLASGQTRPHYDSDPPSSGPHRAATITANNEKISDDQLLQALSLGNVVVLYSTPQPPRGLKTIADDVSPPFTPALARSGQAVILARRPGLTKVTAVAWTRVLRSDNGADLRAFAGYWLGRRAGATTAKTVVGSD
jgi:hypothetical protein